MSLRDFLLLSLICLVWGLNLVATRWVVVDVPPFAYAFIRFAAIAVILAPFLFPAPRQLGLVAIVGLCVGGLNFAFLFLALKNGTASSVAIAGQLGLPFTTILSMAFLSETVGWRRGLGMGLAFAGVVLIAYDPETFGLSLGVVFAVLAALVGSIGGIVMKRMDPIGPFQLQAWVAMVSWPLLLPLSLFTEVGQFEAMKAGGWGFLAALAFSVFAVSIFGHSMFYEIVKKYEVTLVAPLTLMTPIWAVVFAVILLHEPLTPQLAAGAALALTGVGMIAARPNAALRKLVGLFREWTA
jgi:O-acetylserine/cysteine efflux transporter